MRKANVKKKRKEMQKKGRKTHIAQTCVPAEKPVDFRNFAREFYKHSEDLVLML
jgi:hypothetical protein